MQPVAVTGPAAALVSGEGVRLELATAGVASRILAALVDAAIQLGAFFVLAVVDVVLVRGSDSAGAAAVIVVELVLVVAGYPIVSEWLTRGRTVGKAVFGLRVVRDDGGPIGFRQALVRGLAGLVLEKPGLLAPLTTVAGLTVLSSSTREKRIGDMMAGTVVLNERSAPQLLGAPPAWVPVPLQPWVLSLDLSRLDDRLALAVRQFIGRAHAMSVPSQAALGEDLRCRVLAAVSPPPPLFATTPDILMGVLAERRRRAQAGTPEPWLRTHVGAPPPAQYSAAQAQPVSPFTAPS